RRGYDHEIRAGFRPPRQRAGLSRLGKTKIVRPTLSIARGLLLIAALSLSPSAQTSDSAGLETVLQKMDSASAAFQTAQADFVWDQYQKVVDETDTQKGT